MTRLLLALLLIAALGVPRPAAGPAPIPLEGTGYELVDGGAPRPSTVDRLRTAAIPVAAPSLTPSPATGTGAARVAGAPDPDSSGAHLRGIASWFPEDGMVAAAGPRLRRELGRDWRGTLVRVCADRCVTVRLSDWCQCLRRTDDERLIDLASGAYRRLAPLSTGLIRVTVDTLSMPETDR